MLHATELTDEDISAIPQDKLVKILNAQIDGARSELQSLYSSLEEEKLSVTELEYKHRELEAILNDEKKKLQFKEKSKQTVNKQLIDLRGKISEQESKIKHFKGGSEGDTIKASEIEKLQSQLEKEAGNVLKYQALIEKRRNELAAIDSQFANELDAIQYEIKLTNDEKNKIIDLIELHMQRLSLMKQRNEACLKSVVSHSLDSQLTATLEEFAN